MWGFAGQMMRGARRDRGAGSRTWPMLIGAGVGIAAWEIARRQDYSWMGRMITQRGGSSSRRPASAAGE